MVAAFELSLTRPKACYALQASRSWGLIASFVEAVRVDGAERLDCSVRAVGLRGLPARQPLPRDIEERHHRRLVKKGLVALLLAFSFCH